nr:lipopolysaccharide kinase InaA family protein [Bacteroides sp. 519]
MNPKYTILESFINSIPQIFQDEGKEIYGGRNLIKVFSYNGLEINVKRYAIPNVFNRFIYSFIRKPKGLRAYTYPKTLLDKGFETPEPIAYIENRKAGLIEYSYFISIQSPYKFRFYQFGDANAEEYKDIIVAFAHYTARLHEAGILHKDYSPGNILFDKIDGEYRFSLVDINRMRFGKVDLETGCANFARLWGQIPFFEILASEYAKARNADEAYCRKQIMYYRKRFWKRYAKRHQVGFKLEL